MVEEIKKKISERAHENMQRGFHCSESVLLAAGEHYLGKVPNLALRVSTPFAGGVGSSNCELCGALAGGVLLIGALHGRTSAGEDDECCQKLACSYRQRFSEYFGNTQCQALKADWVVKSGQGSCAMLVERAAVLLVEVLEEN